MKKIEILAPAGGMEQLEYAINAGCEAVYLGATLFSARGNANNFTMEELEVAIDYAHMREVSVYLAMNTLIKNEEMAEALEVLNKAYQWGIDAVIVQDIGFATQVMKHFPDLPIHGSTQMSIQSLEGVLFLQEMGFQRVVLSRELTIEQIKKIKENSTIEIEVFVHGALCYSYSGQCLLSSMIGGRSGNRGQCAQPCRLPYQLSVDGELINEPAYLLSPKDLAAKELVNQLAEIGITSLKIEGRMRSKEYVYQTVKAYKDMLNKVKSQVSFEKIKEIYQRGDFTQGYLTGQVKGMLTLNKPNHLGLLIGTVKTVVDDYYGNQLITLDTDTSFAVGDVLSVRFGRREANLTVSAEGLRKNAYEVTSRDVPVGASVYRIKSQQLNDDIKDSNDKEGKQIPVQVTVDFRVDQPFTLSAQYKNHHITEEGQLVQLASKAPIDKERLLKVINKKDQYPFNIKVDKLVLEDGFMPVSAMNELRRNVYNHLAEEIIKPYKRQPVTIDLTLMDNQKAILENTLLVHISNMAQNRWVDDYPLDILECDLEDFKLDDFIKVSETVRAHGSKVFLALPHLLNDTAILKERLDLSSYLPYCDGLTVRTYGEFYFVKKLGLPIRLEKGFNIMNKWSEQFWCDKQEVVSYAQSLELNYKEIEHLKGDQRRSMLTYGKMPVMVSKQCSLGQLTIDYCHKAGETYLIDRKDNLLPVKRYCKQCYSVIYNPIPLYLLDRLDEINPLAGEQVIYFTDEDFEETIKILDQLTPEKQREKSNPLEDWTRGHYNRGVQ